MAPSVRLHIKILSDPDTFSIEEAVKNTQDLYSAVGIHLMKMSTERLDLPLLQDVYVGSCSRGDTTLDQEKLFKNRNNAEANEIVAYLVRSTKPALNGCAAYPHGQPGVVIAGIASPWTLAHEIGHVLGLAHVNDPDRLMTGSGTNGITNLPPDISAEEAEVMLRSAFIFEEDEEPITVASFTSRSTGVSAVSDDQGRTEIIRFLQAEEPDYKIARDNFGPEALDILSEIAASPDVLLATKAIHLASRLNDPENKFRKMAEKLAASEDARIRVAVADSIKELGDNVEIVSTLIGDADVGVRKTSIATASASTQADALDPHLKQRLTDKLEEVSRNDSNAEIRELAKEALVGNKSIQ